MRLKRSLAQATVTVALVSSVLPASPAAADDARADLVSVRAANLAINSTNCKLTPVNVQWRTAPGITVVSAFADVYRGSRIIDSHDVQTSSTYTYCPFFNGIGTFHFGPKTQVNFFDQGFNDFLAVDDTTGSFAAKLLGRTSQYVSRNGIRVTVKVAHTRYNLDSNSFTPWGPSRTALQWQLPDGRWYTYKTVGAVGSRFSITFNAGKARTYRAVSATSAAVWGRTSTPVRR